jgi:galactosylceramidase
MRTDSLMAFLGTLGVMMATMAMAQPLTVRVDPAAGGRTFEGVGALSAGASSRLLIDYPDAPRQQVLDLLFRPNFGASLHHLKVEIGGDINSTCGTEPAFARSREELLSPRREQFDRGYEHTLMIEARRRNPAIFLDVLQWGAPDWIGDLDHPDQGNPNDLPWEQRVPRNQRKFFTQDNADFIATYLGGLREHHGLDVNFCGVWNEMHCDTEWVKRLRRTLDARGLQSVRIIAPDHTSEKWEDIWALAGPLSRDPELFAAVHAIGGHYPGPMPYTHKTYRSTEEAQRVGKPLWSSEDGPWREDWQGAREIARSINRNYVVGKMTKTIFWSLVTSYYDHLPIPGSGLMRANTPWSGHYATRPAMWAVAHTTQFAQPGWVYLDDACVLLPDDAGSVVTLRSPDGRDASVIVETMTATTPTTLTLHLAASIGAQRLHVWRSTEQSQFDRLDDLVVRDGVATITLEPAAIYSITTTTGQQKGGFADVPPEQAFPLPYRDDFDDRAAGAMPRYFADQGGAFEIADGDGGDRGRVLRQVITRRGIDWNAHPTPLPYTLVGATDWRDYAVSCDVRTDGDGYAGVYGRVVQSPQSGDPARGYWLSLADDGAWELKAFTTSLARGTVAADAGPWRRLSLRFAGSRITASIDGQVVAELDDQSFEHGSAGLCSGWNVASFDRFVVEPLSP